MAGRTDVLIVGAGPFGLGVAAHALHEGLEVRVVGDPMSFWRDHMPTGMVLRSGADWHLDVRGEHTIERFLRERGLPCDDETPLLRRAYLDYAAWFQERKGIEVTPRRVVKLDRRVEAGRPFRAWLDDGGTVDARRVVLAVGFGYFAHCPLALTRLLPTGRWSHTCDLVDFKELRGRRCLIVGGRQSAFEWAALLHEGGAAQVHLSHRHDSPAFAESDWSWVGALVDRIAVDPGWYRRLTDAEKKALGHRFWAEGRLKVEPWLEARTRHETIRLWPNTRVLACETLGNGDLAVRLDDGRLTVDHVVLATGYAVDMSRIPFLADTGLMGDLAVTDGFPELDERFQTGVPGLFVTSMPATRDFGPFFAFTVSVRASSKLIVEALVAGS